MTCIAAIRGEGTLGLVGGIRLLGDSRKAVMASLRALRERGIRPYDFQTGVDDPAEFLHEAVTKINGSRMGNSRQSKRKGRRGGLAKGFHAQERRNGFVDEEILKRLWACQYLTGPEIVAILGPAFSVSTMHRMHGSRPKFIKRVSLNSEQVAHAWAKRRKKYGPNGRRK